MWAPSSLLNKLKISNSVADSVRIPNRELQVLRKLPFSYTLTIIFPSREESKKAGKIYHLTWRFLRSCATFPSISQTFPSSLPFGVEIYTGITPESYALTTALDSLVEISRLKLCFNVGKLTTERERERGKVIFTVASTLQLGIVLLTARWRGRARWQNARGSKHNGRRVERFLAGCDQNAGKEVSKKKHKKRTMTLSNWFWGSDGVDKCNYFDFFFLQKIFKNEIINRKWLPLWPNDLKIGPQGD